jgi:ribosomal protein S18 acetylase RimI-like enzyme
MTSPLITIREARRDDLDQVVTYIVRFYRVNEEFDPLYALRQEVEEAARKLVESYLSSPNSIFIVAEADGRIVGIARGELRENPLLEASPLGVIVELYVHPSYRRRGIARMLVEELARRFKERGAKAIAAEFPYLNEIAVSFYKKLGFRPLTSIYVKEAE